MPREYVKELRGDGRGEAIDTYHHIDRQELREAYLAYIPKLGVKLSSEAVEVGENTTGRSQGLGRKLRK